MGAGEKTGKINVISPSKTGNTTKPGNRIPDRPFNTNDNVSYRWTTLTLANTLKNTTTGRSLALKISILYSRKNNSQAR